MNSVLVLFLFFTTGKKNIDFKNLKPEARRIYILNLVKEEKYDSALSISGNTELHSYIQILNGNTDEGLMDIKDRAKKGGITACQVFLLLKSGTTEEDVKSFIKFSLGIDTTVQFSSGYPELLLFPEDTISVDTLNSDSTLVPYSLFIEGIEYLETEKKKAADIFKRLIERFPNSIPSIITRNLMSLIKYEE